MEVTNRSVGYLNKIIFAILGSYIFLVPLLFLHFTTEFNEYNKLVLTIFVAIILICLWAVRHVVDQKVTITHTAIDFPLTLLIVSFIGATIFSVSRSTSIFGETNSWHWTAIELVAFATIFYTALSVVKTQKHVDLLMRIFFAAGFVSSVATLISFFNILDKVQVGGIIGELVKVLSIDGFSPSGSPVSALLVFTITGLVGFELIRRRLVDSGATTLLMRFVDVKVITYVVTILPIIVAFSIWLLSFLPGPLNGKLPITQLNFETSWRIASSTIRDSKFFGVGLSNYTVAYNAFRPLAINNTSSWSVIFDRSGSEYMTILTTAGIVGFVSFLFFVFRLLNLFWREARTVFTDKKKEVRQSLVVSFGVVILLVVYGFVSSTVMTTALLFILLIIWFGQENTVGNEKMVSNTMLSFAAINKSNTRDLLPVVLGIPVVVVAIVVGFYTVQDFRSNVAYAGSLKALADNEAAKVIYEGQQRAINLNSRRDAYRRAYAETNMLFANAVAQQRGENLSDGDRTDISTLIQQAINEVRVITEVLNPASAVNWQLRGSVYQRLLGVATGADQWAAEAFGAAIQRAPFDPRLRVNLGSLYFTLAVNPPKEQGTTGEAPTDTRAQTPETKNELLVAAEKAYLDAISLKDDYAIAHFNLAAVYKEAQRYDLAQSRLEKTLELVEPNSQDYTEVNKQLDEVNALNEASPRPDAPTN